MGLNNLLTVPQCVNVSDHLIPALSDFMGVVFVCVFVYVCGGFFPATLVISVMD